MLRDVMAHNRCVILFGLTIGNSLMMPPLWLAENVWHAPLWPDRRDQPASSPWPASQAAPALIGLIYELSGVYAAPFPGVAGLTLVGFAVLATRGTVRR